MPRLNPRGRRCLLLSPEARRRYNRHANARRNLFPHPDNQADDLGVQPVIVDQQVPIPNNQNNDNEPVFEPIDDHMFFNDSNIDQIHQPPPINDEFNHQSMHDPQFLDIDVISLTNSITYDSSFVNSAMKNNSL